MAKPKLKTAAKELRTQGKSIKFIAKKLHVAQSTASLWCREVKLTKKQIQQLENQGKDPMYGKRLAYSLLQQKKRQEKTKKLFNEGKNEIGQLTKRELFLIGISLYWAEGFKKDSRAGLANSNPKMIKLFLKWLYVCCGYSKDDISLRITANSSHKHRINKIMRFWEKQTKIDKKHFKKPYFQNTNWKKQYDNPNNYYGVLQVRVKKSKDFLRKIHGWIEGLAINGQI